MSTLYPETEKGFDWVLSFFVDHIIVTLNYLPFLETTYCRSLLLAYLKKLNLLNHEDSQKTLAGFWGNPKIDQASDLNWTETVGKGKSLTGSHSVTMVPVFKDHQRWKQLPTIFLNFPNFPFLLNLEGVPISRPSCRLPRVKCNTALRRDNDNGSPYSIHHTT